MRTVWLIYEGDTDLLIFEQIIKAKQYSIKPIGARSGLPNLVGYLDKMILSIFKREDYWQGDCIAVLYDADEHTDRKKQKEIEQVCRKYCQENTRHVIRLVARNAIEAWVLADEGVCHEFSKTPQNWDEEADPKSELARWLSSKNKRVRPTYDILKKRVAPHINGSGGKHSPSLRASLRCLEKCDCQDKACQMKYD